jgi:hypothetical protein
MVASGEFGILEVIAYKVNKKISGVLCFSGNFISDR